MSSHGCQSPDVSDVRMEGVQQPQILRFSLEDGMGW